MLLFFIFVQFVFSIAFIITKSTLLHVSPIFMVSMRSLLAALPILAYYLFKDKQYKISNSEKKLLMGVALFNVIIPNIFESIGMLTLKAATANFIYSLSPFLTAIFGYFGFFGLHEKMTIKKVLGMALGLIGFLIFVLLGSNSAGSCAVGAAEIYLLIATAGNIIGWIFVKRLIEKGMPISLINGGSMMIGFFVSIATAMLFEKQWIYGSYMTAFNWLALSAFVTFVVAYNCKSYLLKFFSATFAAVGIFISPLLTALLGFIFLGETVSSIFFLSLVFIFSGVYIFFKEEKPLK